MYKLKYLRESELLTQKQIAEKIFCGQRAYSYYETGERDIPTQTLVRLADFYNVSVDYILGRTENPKTQKPLPLREAVLLLKWSVSSSAGISR